MIGSSFFDNRQIDVVWIPNFNDYINIAYNVLNGNLRVFKHDDVVGFIATFAGKPQNHGGGTYYLTLGGHHFYSTASHGTGNTVELVDTGYRPISTPAGAEGEGSKSNMSASFYPPFADPKTYPFWSYGVTFHSTDSIDENNGLYMTDEEYDQLDHWAMTYDETRMKDLSDFIPSVVGDVPPEELAAMINYYINQGDYPDVIRGLSKETIKKSGCLDSTVAMIASFWSGKQVPVTFVSQYVGAGAQLDTARALSQFGLRQSGNIYGNFVDGVKAELNAGHPPIVHIRGEWGSYHTSSNGHFLTIYSYDDNGFYVMDPGKRANHYIPYSAWASAGDLYYRKVYKP